MSQPSRSVVRTVATGFTALFVSFGVAYSFGVFLPAIAAEFRAGASQRAGLFSATAFVFFCLGALTGPWAERHGVRWLLVAAAALLGTGLIGSSLAPNLAMAYLTYGLGTGLGVGCVLVPIVGHVGAMAPPRKRALAVGLAVTGIGLGTLLGAPVAEYLISEQGWRGAQRSLAVAVAAALLVCAGLTAERHRTAPVRGLYPRQIVRSGRFVWLWVSTALASSVLYTPFVALPAQAATLGVSPGTAAGLVGLIGLASVAGRLVISAVRLPVTLLRTHTGAVALATASVGLWAVSRGVGGLAVFVVLFGLGYGAFIALLPLVLSALFSTERLSSLLGLQYVASGVGAVLGPIGTGLLVDTTGAYTPAFVALLLIGAAGTAVLTLLVRSRAAHPDQRPP